MGHRADSTEDRLHLPMRWIQYEGQVPQKSAAAARAPRRGGKTITLRCDALKERVAVSERISRRRSIVRYVETGRKFVDLFPAYAGKVLTFVVGATTEFTGEPLVGDFLLNSGYLDWDGGSPILDRWEALR